MTKYILYCGQEGNFGTRSMLIPYDQYIKNPEREKNLEILRNYAKKNVKIDDHIVDHLLILNYKFEGNRGTQVQTPYSDIVNKLTSYADMRDYEERWVFTLSDFEWINEAIPGIASSGFNHVLNYCNYKKNTDYDIVEGFLVLVSRDDKIQTPMSDTADEMLSNICKIQDTENKKII